MKKKRKFPDRSLYVFWENKVVVLKKGTNFQKLFHKWYMSGSNIVPCRIYDYLEREGIIKKNNHFK